MLSLWQLAFLLVGLAVGKEVVLKPRPEVSSPAGTFRGKVLTAPSGSEFASYRGIPFALPPTGERRFALPEPFPKIQDSIYDASDFGPMCLQTVDGVSLGDEDCLYLNVYTPLSDTGSEDSQLKEVLVFIYGGGFVTGSSNIYIAGDLVAKNNVLVVTFNYRLGWLGFLRGNNQSLPGNQAFWDQVLALKWVRHNILDFGGNPNDVTLSGESAGALSVSILSISPLAKDLFTKAILMSGSAFKFPTPPQTSTDLLEKISPPLGCGHEIDVAFCLKRLPHNSFYTEFSTDLMSLLPSSGDALLPKPIRDLVNDLQYLNEVGFFNRSYIVSITKHDGYIRINSRFGKIDTTSLESSVLGMSKLLHLSECITKLLVLEYLKLYQELERAVIAINTDFFYILRSKDFMEAYVKRALRDSHTLKKNIYFMSFDPVSMYFPHQYVVHVMDLLYLFDLDSKTFLESFYFNEVEGGMADDNLELKAVYSDMVAAFMKTGNPNDYLVQQKDIEWPPYENTNKSYLSFSLEPSVYQDLIGARRVIWEELLPRWKNEYSTLQIKVPGLV